MGRLGGSPACPAGGRHDGLPVTLKFARDGCEPCTYNVILFVSLTSLEKMIKTDECMLDVHIRHKQEEMVLFKLES